MRQEKLRQFADDAPVEDDSEDHRPKKPPGGGDD